MRDESSGTRDPVEELAEEFFERRRRGETLDIEDYAKQHPDWTDDLRELLPTLAQLEEATAEQSKPAPAGLGPGETLGDYELVKEIGRGGMGIVFLALDTKLKRRVALKLLPPHALLDTQLRERFQREASAAARLRHPGIVPVFGVGDADGVPYYAMEFVEGETLDAVLNDVREISPGSSSTTAETPWDPRSAAATSVRSYFRCVARLALQAAEALDHAHSEGVVHRDIKPGNLMLDKDGAIRITDFGLCQAEGAKDLTRTRDVLGTLRYMAPEQMRGDADARSDVMSLGLVLYEMLLRRPAYPAEDRLALVRQVADGRIVPPRRVDRRVPRDLETIVLKATDREPEMRYARAAAMAEDLRAFLDDRPVRARRPSFTYLVGLAIRRNPGAATAWATLIVLAIAGTWIYVASQRRWSANERRQRILAEKRGYAASIAAADGAVARGLTATARQHLDDCPEDLRGWEWHYLGSRIDASTRSIEVAGKYVWSLSFDATGETLAVAGSGGPVSLVDWKSGEVRSELAHPRKVPRAIFLGDGALATCCYDGRIRIWDVETEKLTKSWKAHSRGVTGMAYEPVTDTLVSTGYDGTVAVWNMSEGSLRYRIAVGAQTWPPAVSPDGKRFAAAARDNLVRVWRLDDGAELAALTFMQDQPKRRHGTWVDFSPDGRWLACSDYAGSICLFDAETLEPKDVLPRESHIWGLKFVDAARIAAGYADTHALIWDIARRVVVDDLRGHDYSVFSVGVSRDKRTILTGSDTVKTWHPPVDRSPAYLNGTTKEGVRAACALDARRLVTGGMDGRLVVWDVEEKAALRVFDGHKAGIVGVAASPDGRMIVSGDRRGEVIAWKVEDGTELWRARPAHHTAADIDFRDDGAELVVAAGKLAAVILDARDGAVLRTLNGPGGTQAWAARYVAGGTRIVASYNDGTVELRDARTAATIWRVEKPGGRSVAVPNPQGTLIACGDGDGDVRLLDADTGRLVHTLKGHAIGVFWPGFTSDGKRLATSSEDRTTKIWDPEIGIELLTLRERTAWRYRSVFAPDESWLAVTTSITTRGDIRIYPR